MKLYVSILTLLFSSSLRLNCLRVSKTSIIIIITIIVILNLHTNTKFRTDF